MSAPVSAFPGRNTRLYRSLTQWLPSAASLLLCSAGAAAATLGPIQVSSALGERFAATVSVQQTDGTSISPACLQLIPSQEGAEIRNLRRARLDYRETSQGGIIGIHGDEIEQEPVLKIAIRLRCPEEGSRSFVREYSVLLDPKDYAAPAGIPVVTATVAATPAAPTTQAAAVPRSVRRSGVSGTAPAKSARTAKPRNPASTKPAVPVTVPSDFSLKLSTAPLDAQRTSVQLSDSEKTMLRERLLLIETDDQSAQLLQLKDRVARMEKQLLAMQMRAASQVAAQAVSVQKQAVAPEQDINWLWPGLLGLLLIPAGLLARRFRSTKSQETYLLDEPPQAEPEIETPVPPASPVIVTSPSAAVAASVTPLARKDEWADDSMDVVAPETVLEEVQLLQLHGLTRQAIDLLSQEVATRPTALALWMKLFAIHQEAGDRTGFEQHARTFRESFVSESLWRQVQAQGRTLDPENPLYHADAGQADDAHSSPAPFFFCQLFSVENTMPQGESTRTTDEMLDVTLDFRLPDETHEAVPPPSPADPALPKRSETPIFDFDIPSLELPASPISNSKLLSADDFSSQDPLLQNIAQVVLSGNHEEACRQLEELLYRGTLEQRLVAAKWLDKLLPVK